MLIHERSRNVVLNLRDPKRVIDVIPHAKQISLQGRDLLAVPHDADEVRLLRNLGFDVTSPVAHYYDYVGMYQPFAHQRATVEFLTTNPRAFTTSGLGCIAGDETVRVSRQGKSYESDLRTLFKKFHSAKPGTIWKARSLMGERFGMNNLLDVLYQGVKPTLRLTLADGKTFRCTRDHRIARPDGSWTEAGDLRVGDALVTNGHTRVSPASCGRVVVLPKASDIVAIEDGGETDVYDLCMEAPHHNFVVNGVVVHNSGKTLCGLWGYDFLRQTGAVRKMLVVGPLSTLERAWGDEIIRNFPHLEYAVLHGALDKRLSLLARKDIDIYIINHDGLGNDNVLEALCQREDIELVIVDELAVYRNKSTDRWKRLDRLINGKRVRGVPDPNYPVRKWAWGFTGTPIPNAPTDAWAQCRLINPSRAPRTFGEFRNLTMRQITQFKWVAKPDALESVYKVMQPCIRFAREDCIDLPPTTYITRQVALSKEQQRAYDEMLKHLRAVTAAGELTAANEAVKLGRLLQICAGGSYAQDGQQVHLPCGPRVTEVLEVIDEAAAKVIVFVPYTAALEMVAKEISRHHTVAVVHGGTTKVQRDQIFGEFQNAPNPRVLVANPGTVSHGLTLTAADTIVWFAPVHSNEIWEQANGRIARPGQRLNTRIVSIEGSPAERRVYERLKNKGRVQGVLLDMLKEGDAT